MKNYFYLKTILSIFILTFAFSLPSCGDSGSGGASVVATPAANRSAAVTPEIILSTVTDGAEIWYTIDGITIPVPEENVGIEYAAPIPIGSGVTIIMAIAVKDGMTNSGILEVEYTIFDFPMETIPAGNFTMGSPATEPNRYPDETQHSVTLTKDFYMSKYQVTQELYEDVIGANPSYFQGTGRPPESGETQAKRPVEQVSWYDAIVFCNKLSMMEGFTPVYKMPGYGNSTNPADWGTVPTSSNGTWNAVIADWDANGYRLPTEAEWEYACRAGTTTAYNTGDTLNTNTGWYGENASARTHEVGKKPANAWGLHDMHGNVSEWCWDWYYGYYSSLQVDPVGPVAGISPSRVIRGGAWIHGWWREYLRSAFRYFYNPNYRDNLIGFRLVRS